MFHIVIIFISKIRLRYRTTKVFIHCQSIIKRTDTRKIHTTHWNVKHLPHSSHKRCINQNHLIVYLGLTIDILLHLWIEILTISHQKLIICIYSYCSQSFRQRKYLFWTIRVIRIRRNIVWFVDLYQFLPLSQCV